MATKMTELYSQILRDYHDGINNMNPQLLNSAIRSFLDYRSKGGIKEFVELENLCRGLHYLPSNERFFPDENYKIDLPNGTRRIEIDYSLDEVHSIFMEKGGYIPQLESFPLKQLIHELIGSYTDKNFFGLIFKDKP